MVQFSEATRVQMPAMVHLTRLGYEYAGKMHESMKEDYEAGKISNPAYEPYFRWKVCDAPISIFTKDMLYEIAETSQREMEALDEKHPEAYKQLGDVATLEDVWKPYAGYGEDKYLYSYLSAIDSETANLLLVV